MRVLACAWALASALAVPALAPAPEPAAKPRYVIDTPHTQAATTVAFSPDGKWLASGGWDNAVKLTDTATGKITTLTGHTDAVLAVAFSPPTARRSPPPAGISASASGTWRP